MIQTDSLTLAFGDRILIQDGSFTLQKGEKLGLVGKNGSGKTTLFKAILSELSLEGGKIQIKKNYRVSTVRQHIRFSKSTILDEAILSLPENQKDCIYKAETVLFGLGFTEHDLQKDPASFSGGYQLRLHLAKTLIEEPDCLLLDEPTNYLDILSIRWFEQFLKQWPGELILITHDREFMDQVCTSTLGIHRQKLKKVSGGTERYFEQIFQEEEIHEKTAIAIEKKKEAARKWIERFGAKATKAAQARSRQKAADKLGVLERLNQLESLSFDFHEAPFEAKVMADVADISFSYDQPLIKNVGFSIEKGERIAIIGKNGRGKSTLLKLIAGQLTPKSGEIKRSIHVKEGYFGQTNIDHLHPNNTVEEEIAMANPALLRAEVLGIAGVMLFSGKASEKKCSVLSGGERARVLLGKIIAAPCNLLLLDEPTHHLDMESIEALIEALDAFSGSVIIVTHSERLLKQVHFDKLIVMESSGQRLFLGGYENFLEKHGWEEEVKEEKKGEGKSLKDERKERAEKVQQRSRLLKPIETKIQSLEKKITEGEILLQKTHDDLQEASINQESGRIQLLSKQIAELNRQLEGWYEELEEFLEKKEAVLNE